MAKTKYKPMWIYPFYGYFEEQLEKCVQVEFNKDGSADIYDYKTGKHLKHFNKAK